MRVMAVVSGDYGELGLALYFLQGLRLGRPPVVAVPPALAEAVAGSPGVESRVFDGYRDLADLCRLERPDVVLLASGYLLAINSLLTIADTARLLRLLARGGAAVLTSDPFLGVVRSPAVIDFRTLAERRGQRGGVVRYAARRCLYAAVAAAMYAHLAIVARLLRRAWHVYPVPARRLRSRPGVRALCFHTDAPAPAPRDAGRPAWIFVLSKVDHDLHSGDARPAFAARVARRLHEAVAMGRDVQVIGPPAFIEALAPHVAGEPRIAARNVASHEHYLADLVRAEYAFFWNYYSFSVLHRVLAGKPVLFFDAGHLVHILPPIAEEGVRVFYGGWRPPLLDADVALDEERLGKAAAQAEERFRGIAASLRECPAPQELLAHVRGGRGVSG